MTSHVVPTWIVDITKYQTIECRPVCVISLFVKIQNMLSSTSLLSTSNSLQISQLLGLVP